MLCQNQLFATKHNWIQFEVSISDIIRDDCNFICVRDCVVCKLTKNPFTNNNITNNTDLITTDFDKQKLARTNGIKLHILETRQKVLMLEEAKLDSDRERLHT